MEAKIPRMQYFYMIPNLVFGKAIGITAGIMTRKIGSDTWTSMTIGFIIGSLVMIMMTFLGSRFPDKTVVQYSEELLGKWLGRFIGILLTLFFIMAFGASANVMTLHLNEYFLPDTPVIIICVLYTALCMYGVFLGVEVAVRFSLLGFVMLMLINIAMVTGTLKDFEAINLMPLFDKGITADILNSYYIFGDISFAILAIGFMYPLLNKKKKVGSLTILASVLAGCMVVIWPMFETAVMGTGMMKQYVVVCMQQIRCAQLTRYFPRYELLMVSFFTFSVFVQSVVMFHCAKYSFKQVTGIKKDWAIILPFTLIMVLVTYFMVGDHNKFINFLSFPYSQICAILGIGLPMILFFTALVRGKLKKNQ